MSKAATETPLPAASATPARIRYVTPVVAIWEDDDGYTIEAELPGVTRENVHVTVENGELALAGAKHSGPAGARIYGEATHADYRRVFDLDPAVDSSKISARMDQGLLSLRLPRAQDKKPRTIKVAD